jgi:hypothetical protein
MNEALDNLLQQPGIWRGNRPAAVATESISSGFPALDKLLPGGGWPLGALTELSAPFGIGALNLVMPALARLSREGRWLAWIAPPYIPYAPALAVQGVELSRVLLVHPRTGTDGLWAVEQALRSGTCGAVLAWPAAGDERALRRLQLAAEEGRAWGVLFRSPGSTPQSSPAALRLALEPAPDDGLTVHVLKRRGGWPARTLVSLATSDLFHTEDTEETRRNATTHSSDPRLHRKGRRGNQ